MLEHCLELITAQQGTDTRVNLYWLGEQLKDICRTTAGAAELVAADIVQAGMGLADAEKKIKAYADAHKRGREACVPPPVADEILRTFYGLPKPGAEPPPASPAPQEDKLVNILDFL